jgi:Protein of unknown function (DUF3302)
MMETTFGILDAFAFVVFAVILLAAVIVIVGVGRLPRQLARKWRHPYAPAVNVAGWVGIATGGLLWPLALIWAFTAPGDVASSKSDDGQDGAARSSAARDVASPRLSPQSATRP